MTKTTKLGIPWSIVWTTSLPSRGYALKLERKIKRRGIKRFLEDNNLNWRELLEV